jgi:hypothetical protein
VQYARHALHHAKQAESGVGELRCNTLLDRLAPETDGATANEPG